MAQLNSSNVVNGNIVESNDILQLYDAFTAGGGTTGVYNVSISGSLTGSATSASYALTASYAANVPVTASYALTASYILNAISSSRAVSSSFATSASFATNSNTAVNATNATYATQISSSVVMPSGSAPLSNYLAVAVGSLIMTGSLATTATSDALKNKVLGQTLFVNTTIFNITGSGQTSGVRSYSPSTGQIQIQTAGGGTSDFVMWTAYYVPS